MTRVPELIQDLRALRDASQVAELEELTRSIPKLIGILPALVRDQADVGQTVAVATMISALTRQLDDALPLALVSWKHFFTSRNDTTSGSLLMPAPRVPISSVAYRWTKQPSYIMHGPLCTLNS
jgi:hypothetical protein